MRDILKAQGAFSDREMQVICEMVYHHSDKHVHSDIPHVELIKDADVFDCSLYSGTEFYYLTRKPLPVCREYFRRVLSVRRELGMPVPDCYCCLEDASKSLDLYGADHICAGYKEFSPTVLLLLLWGLTSAPPCSSIPVAYVYFRDGVLSWYLPSDQPDAGIIDLNILKAAEHAASVAEQRFRGVGDDLASALRESKQLFAPLWSAFGATRVDERRCAVMLRDQTCDPNFEEKLERLIRDAIEFGAPEYSDEWDLNDSQREAVERLILHRRMSVLRGNVCRVLDRALRDHAHGAELLHRFPSEIFGCEESPRIETNSDEWLGVAWPRFAKYELVVGSEASDRIELLHEYFDSGPLDTQFTNVLP